MPGVIVQSNSPSNPLGFGSSHPDSSSAQNNNVAPRSYDGLSVVDIRQRAKDSVIKEAKGINAISLIRTARTQVLTARDYEAKGDLRSAMATYIKAATLTKMAMDSQEYSQENRGKGGVIRKELHDFLETEGQDMTKRTNAIEDKLKAIEITHSRPSGESDFKGTPPVKSIKDRLRALQGSGLSIEQQIPKASRDPSIPNSPRSHQPNHTTNSFPPAPSINPSTSSSSSNSTRAFVSPSTLGPPSPPPSELSSRKGGYLDSDDINGFNRAFPPLDELNNDPIFPSVPTAPPISNSKSSSTTNPTLKEKNGPQFLQGDQPISPSPSSRNFTIPIERPVSTPLTPMNNAFPSRPSSPTTSRTNNAPHKPSALSNGAAPPMPRVHLPVTNTAFPKDLSSYLKDYNVLLIDVRHRAEFDREHIGANAVVCVEPSVLLRDGITAEALENAMIVSPRQEHAVFSNRDKFDLVAIYDSSSTTFGSPISILVRLIWEQAFKKMLRRMPMLLVGGIEAWKKEFGEKKMIRNPGYAPGLEIQRPVPLSTPKGYLADVGISHSRNPFVNRSASPRDSPSIGTTSPTGRDPTTTKSQEHSGHARSPADAVYSGSYISVPSGQLSRRPAIARSTPGSLSFSRSATESATPLISGSHSILNGVPSLVSPISYPLFPPRLSPTTSGSGSGPVPSPNLPLQTTPSPTPPHYDITSPPQASINPSQSSSRKRSDYVDQSQEALFNSLRSPSATGACTGSIGIGIDYPELSPSPLVRPPPPVATPSLSERQDIRPRRPQAFSTSAVPTTASDTLSNGPPTPPRIPSDYPVSFWSDMQIGVSGLKNLGNTCYMNAPIQCLSATVPFARFFTEGRWKTGINYTNPLGSKGQLTGAFAKLLHEMWGGDLPYLTPIDFRRSICSLNAQYLGSDQHDSQEFLSFLIDGIHEDLNRIIVKPTLKPTPEEDAELDMLPPQIGSEREWRTWKSRNDSLIVDYFQGQFRNRLECLTCHKTSTTYNVFSILSLPIPNTRSGKVPIQRCIDAFFNAEVLEKDDAWDCPKCKTKVRASKKLSLARLPPILMIHMKRFEANGRFSDKVDTFVDFPIKSLDLTNYMPPPLPHGADKPGLTKAFTSPDDPRTQLPPYRYDLYGVTNHYGNLSSGHYTAFIASKGGWLYCDDSSVRSVDTKEVVNQKAYVLFYKRVRS